jgi:hypothetical protein
MRTKTLILSAVALAAGLLSSQAQVYSANVVGYYNITVPGHGRHFLANQLTNSGGITVDLKSAPVSDPNGANGTSYNYWNNSTHAYTTYVYFTDADAQFNFGTASQGNGWYDGGGLIHNDNLNQGGAAFIINPQTTNITLTLVGQVVQGSYRLTVAPGYNGLSLIPPVATNLTTFASFPGFSDPNGANGDSLNVWDDSIQSYHTTVYFTDADAQFNFGTPSQGNGFYDGGGTRQDLTNPNDNPKVGGAFFLIRPSTGTSNWVYSFTVQ